MKAKILSEEILSHRWGKYSAYKIAYTRTDGVQQIQVREVQDTGNGATILLYNQKRKTIILVEQFRLPTMINGHPTGVIIESIAGLIEKGEDPLSAITREIKEETGIETKGIAYLFSAYATPGAKTEKIYFFVGVYDEAPLAIGGASNEQEDIRILEMEFDTAYEMISQQKIEDAKTIILLQWAKMNIFVG